MYATPTQWTLEDYNVAFTLAWDPGSEALRCRACGTAPPWGNEVCAGCDALIPPDDWDTADRRVRALLREREHDVSARHVPECPTTCPCRGGNDQAEPPRLPLCTQTLDALDRSLHAIFSDEFDAALRRTETEVGDGM